MLKNKAQWIVVALYLLLVFLIPKALSNYFIYLASLIAVYGITAQGLNVLLGFSGQISIGHAGFMAFGAYVSAYFAKNITHNLLLVWLVVVTSAILVGYFIGYICLRMKGPYLALTTIGIMTIIKVLATNMISVTGGPDGIVSVPAFHLGPLVFKSPEAKFYLVMFTFGAVLLFIRNFRESRAGRAMIAIKDDDISAGMNGINVTRYKVTAFVLSTVLACISGSLYSTVTSTVFPDVFNLALSAQFVMMLVLGGMGNITGGLIGSTIIVGLFEGLRQFQQYQSIVYSVLVILCIMYMPQGIMGLVNQALRKMGYDVGRIVTVPKSMWYPHLKKQKEGTLE